MVPWPRVSLRPKSRSRAVGKRTFCEFSTSLSFSQVTALFMLSTLLQLVSYLLHFTCCLIASHILPQPALLMLLSHLMSPTTRPLAALKVHFQTNFTTPELDAGLNPLCFKQAPYSAVITGALCITLNRKSVRIHTDFRAAILELANQEAEAAVGSLRNNTTAKRLYINAHPCSAPELLSVQTTFPPLDAESIATN